MSTSPHNTVFVTGGCGFIGSHTVLHWHNTYPQMRIVNIDSLTYAANPKFLEHLGTSERYHFEHQDIRDRENLKKLFQKYEPDAVIHLAAETHVDNSITGPDDFITTNVMGTFNLLEEARALWKDKTDTCFLHVSTDEVYGSLSDSGVFTESSPYAPNSPYAASKAASDHLVRAAYKTYGLPTRITHCCNNFGPNQHQEKLIPTVIHKALSGQGIPVYGQGTNVREWLYVQDHCHALDLVLHKGSDGETYNIGSGHEEQNIKLVQSICSHLNTLSPQAGGKDYSEQITFVSDRPGHDFRYALDSTKIQTELGFKPQSSFAQNLKDTVTWYLEHRRES